MSAKLFLKYADEDWKKINTTTTKTTKEPSSQRFVVVT